MSQISPQKQWLQLFDLRRSAAALCCFFIPKEMIVCRPAKRADQGIFQLGGSILRDASRSLSPGAHSRDPLAMLLQR
jgi:hypothetical protein